MLRLEGVDKTFDANLPTRTTLFSGFNYRIEKGDFVSIVGSNGSGKTTLLNLVAGTVPCDNGSIYIMGKDVTKLKEFRRAKYIARVFQDPKLGTCPTMTVAENMAMAANKGRPYALKTCLKKKDIPKYKDMLAVLGMGLEDKTGVLAGQLSGGQRQALALLMASISKPDLLLLDEHTAALDPRTSANIMALTERIVMERRITTLMVTHNLDYAISFGTRLTMMHAGHVLFDVSGDEKKLQTIDGLIDMFHDAQGGAVSDTMAFH
jgi:putative ABC transport system ATP-binding protein